MRISGLKREEEVGGLIRLHNEEFHNLYASPNIVRVIKSRRMGWAGHVARMGEMRNSYKTLVGEFERKGPRGGSRQRWEDNIIMDLGEIGWDGLDGIHLAQDTDQRRAVVNTVMNLRVT